MKWIITVVIFMALLPLVQQPKKPAHAVQINNPVQAQPEQQVTTKAEPTATVPEVTEQAPSPQPEPVPIQPQNPKDIAKQTLNDLGLGDSWYAVDFIVSHESSWNPTVLNSIGACGLFQALPCSKLPCELPDVACQVRWATNYANQRYGSWHNAYNFWVNNKYW